MQVCANPALHEHGVLLCFSVSAPFKASYYQLAGEANWEEEFWLQYYTGRDCRKALHWGAHSWGMVTDVQGLACRPLSKTVRFNVLRVIPAGALQKKAFATF